MSRSVLAGFSAIALFVVACSGSDGVGSGVDGSGAEGGQSIEATVTEEPVAVGDPVRFGSEAGACPGAVLMNDEGDEEALATSVDCLFAEFEAGRAVTVDLNIPTAEGDPIFYRYAYDGESVQVIEDDRADLFGLGEAVLRRCTGLRRSDWVPRGDGCQSPEPHAGFIDADEYLAAHQPTS